MKPSISLLRAVLTASFLTCIVQLVCQAQGQSSPGLVCGTEAKEGSVACLRVWRIDQVIVSVRNSDSASTNYVETPLYHKDGSASGSFDLVDSKGAPVPKTWSGRRASKPLTSTRRGYRNFRDTVPVSFVGNYEHYVGTIDIQKYFNVPKRGRYRLVVGLQLYKEVTRGKLEPISMPPVALDLDLHVPGE